MTYCVYIKHGDITRHQSFIAALHDVIDCIDQHGLEVWWEDPHDSQCQCEAPSSTLVMGRWICDECDLDTDVFAPDELDPEPSTSPGKDPA